VKILLIPLSGRVSKDGIVSNYGGALRAATDLTPNIAFDTSDTSMIGLEGLCLDTIEESLSPGFDKSRTRITLKFPTQLARLVRFRNTFAKKMTARLYPTGENPKVAFVRCLVLEMLTMWDKLYKCLMDHTSISEPNVVYASTDLKAAMMALPLTHIIFEEIKDRTLIIPSLDTLDWDLLTLRQVMSSLLSTAQGFRAYFEKFYPMTPSQWGIPSQGREMLINGKLLGTVISRGSWTMRLLARNGTRKGKCFGSFESRPQYLFPTHDSGKRSVRQLRSNSPYIIAILIS
jgi:hypothetical protein